MSGWALLLLLLIGPIANGQTSEQILKEIKDIVKKEGEIFVSVDQYNKQLERTCTLEDYFTNQIAFSHDSAKVNYLNYTESFCQPTTLRSQFTYQFRLKDIDPTSLKLVQKKYDLKGGKLTDGQDNWFEVQFKMLQGKPLIQMRDTGARTNENIATMRLVFKTQESARNTLTHLRKILSTSGS